MTKIKEKAEETQERKINPKREKLKKLSQQVKPLVQDGEFNSVNEALIDLYEDGENTEFHTFHDWKKKGKKILKGSVAFLIWGKPRKVEQAEDEDEYKYWPVCYLFSNAQVN